MNVLILYTNFGAGHSFVARQLEEDFKQNLSNCNVYVENTKRTSSYRTTKLIEKVYEDVFTRYSSNMFVKKLYGIMFYFANKISLIKYFCVQRTGSKVAEKIIKDKNIDVVICTYPYYLKVDIPCIVVITDYGFFNVWKNKEEDYYLVNDEEYIDMLLKRKIPIEHIFSSRIPISNKFNKTNTSQEIKKVLFNLGARGQGNIKNIMKNIDELLKENLEISVMCGKNIKLLNNLEAKYGQKIKLYSFISNVYDVIYDNDIIVTKAGGISISECIQEEKPMVINLSQTLSGQEKSNYKYIMNKEIGSGEIETKLYKEIKKLVNDKCQYNNYLENIRNVKSKMNSTKDIKDIVKEVL